MASDHDELQEKTIDTLREAEGAMDLTVVEEDVNELPLVTGAKVKRHVIGSDASSSEASVKWGKALFTTWYTVTLVLIIDHYGRALPTESWALKAAVAMFAILTFIKTTATRERAFMFLGFVLTALLITAHANFIESSAGWGTSEIQMVFAILASLSFFMSVKHAWIPTIKWVADFIKWSFGFNAAPTAAVNCGAPGNGLLMTWFVLPISCLCSFFALGALLNLLGQLFARSPDSIKETISGFLILSAIGSLSVRWFANQFAMRRWITFSASGLSFDENYSGSLQGQTTRAWGALHSVEFAGALNERDLLELNKLIGCYLTLSFKPEGSVTLDLSRIARADVVKLLMQVDTHCDHSVFTKQAFAFSQILLGASAVELDVDEQLMTDNLEAQFASTHFMPLSTGTSLQNGRYKILTQIASGGMSSVYAAAMSVDNAKKTNRTNVVVKESVLPFKTDEKSRLKAKELFARESKMLAKLDHPQIVRVLDSFMENGRDYIVLEHKEGPTLRQVRQRKQQNAAGAITEWAYQIAQILEYLHTLTPPVVHRDLTPDNLILGENKKIIAIDFGVSNEFLGDATGTLVGKQSYISPEQFRGKSEPRSDVYSFGATIYYLYTGVDPVPLSVSDPRQTGCVVPDAMAELVIEATQQESSKRPSAQELRIRLQKILEKLTPQL